MTVEIRTGAKRSEQKGTAGTKKFKEGETTERSGQKKRTLSFTKGPEMHVCPVDGPCLDQNK